MKAWPTDFRHSELEIAELGPDLLLIGVEALPAATHSGAEALGRLSPAERSAVELALRGLSNRSIAGARAASPSTIANQLSAAYRKLGVCGRRELIALVNG
ncbi:MAG TPA: helix-turn-helix transcriptional regulator [Polyangiaceae bacterium]